MNSTNSIRKQFSLRSSTQIIVESFLLISVNVLALVGNVTVVAAYVRKPALRNITNTLIIALAISDIFMSLFPMPLSIGALATGQWQYGHLLCAMQGFIVNFLAFVSLQIMALTAINRFYQVLRPLSCQKIFTRFNTVCMILMACLISFGVSVSMIFPNPSQYSFSFHPGKVICIRYNNTEHFYDLIYTVVSSIVFVVFPAAVITVCYTKVFRKLRKHNQNLYSENTNRIGHQNRLTVMRQKSELRRSEITITRTLFGTVLGFFLCWLPCCAIDVVDVMSSEWLDRRVYLMYMYLAYMSSAINPFIYGILNPSFRKEFFNMVTCVEIELA